MSLLGTHVPQERTLPASEQRVRTSDDTVLAIESQAKVALVTRL